MKESKKTVVNCSRNTWNHNCVKICDRTGHVTVTHCCHGHIGHCQPPDDCCHAEAEILMVLAALSLTTSMQSSSSAPSSIQKDAIALFLLEKFIKGNDWPRPSQITDETYFRLARACLHVLPDIPFEQCTPYDQKRRLDSGPIFLIMVLGCKYEASMLDELAAELSPKLEEVFRGRSESLRPFLDVLSKL